MNIEGLLEGLNEDTFEDNFKTVVETCGIDFAKELIKKLSGIQFYVPQPNSPELLKRYVIKRYNDYDLNNTTKIQMIHKLVIETGTSERTIYRLLKKLFNEGVLIDKFKKPVPDNYIEMFE